MFYKIIIVIFSIFRYKNFTQRLYCSKYNREITSYREAEISVTVSKTNGSFDFNYCGILNYYRQLYNNY